MFIKVCPKMWLDFIWFNQDFNTTQIKIKWYTFYFSQKNTERNFRINILLLSWQYLQWWAIKIWNIASVMGTYLNIFI